MLEKKVPNEELHSVYSSINTTSGNKSTRLIRILTWQKVQQRRRKAKAHIFKTAIETYNTGPRKELFNTGSRR